MRSQVRRAALFVTFLTTWLCCTPATANDDGGCTITLEADRPSPQLVGERIVWTAKAANCGTSPVYRFGVAGGDARETEGPESAQLPGEHPGFRIVRDFSHDNTFAWAPLDEGNYAVMVSVKDSFDASAETSTVVSDAVDARVTFGEAVVSPTLNPLVALYSAPPCEGGALAVAFRPANSASDESWTRTNALPCVPGRSRNFIVAGMLPNTSYEMMHVSSSGQSSAPHHFTTGTPPGTLNIPQLTVRQAPGPSSDLTARLVYHNLVGRSGANAVILFGTDLLGRVVWYYDPLRSGLAMIGASGLLPNGTVLLGGRDRFRTLGLNVLREIDLAGNPLRETNIDAVNAQLRSMGQDVIYGFHHEMRLLPHARLVTLGWTERTVVVNGTPTKYAGDLLLVLDQNLQVVWTWNAFDHLDVNSGPILGELCTGAPCPLVGDVDWLHDNAIEWSPADGNLLISIRHLDQVIKIDYARGSGDGHIIWRLGHDGDFSVEATGPSPWFSHQHCPRYLSRSRLLLFDNGNTRQQSDPDTHSRGQEWSLDERTMTATLVRNIDLGNYSDSLGAASRLSNGNFVFTSGSQGLPASFGQLIEVQPDGTKTYVLEVASREYRSFRVSSLYEGVPR